MTWDGRFPFKGGELLCYEEPSGGMYGPGGMCGPDARLTEDEARVTGALAFKGYTRGRSAARLVLTDGEHDFEVFLTDFAPMVACMVKGTIRGSFVPVKRGANFAWRMEV